MENQSRTAIELALTSWKDQVEKITKLVGTLSDQKLQKQISPGRNTGTYLLGHLVASNDAMFPLLGLGENQFPELIGTFITKPDSYPLPKSTIPFLRESWLSVNGTLLREMGWLSPPDWFSRHTGISETDFARSPHLNKLYILAGRTAHLSYHMGQLVLLRY